MNFGGINLEELAQDDERLKNNKNFQDQFVPMPEGPGSIRVRILPPMPGRRLYQYNRIHSINGRKVHCPRPLVSGKWDRRTACPICDYYSHLWDKADKLDNAGRREEAEKCKDEARLIKPLERYYYNVTVRAMTVNGEVKKNVGPRILSVGKDLHSKILKGILGDEDEPGLGDVSNVTQGYDFIIKKEMAGEFPRYSDSCFARERSPAGTPEEIERWSKSLYDLAELRKPKGVDEIESELAIHRGLIPDRSTFDEDAFAAKFKPAAEPSKSPTTTVESVPITVTEQSAVTPPSPACSIVAVEREADDTLVDDQFLKELTAMGLD